VEHVRATIVPLIFQPFRFGGYKRQDDQLLAALRDIAADPRQYTTGWLKHFSLKQVDLVADNFLPYGQVPRDDQINPLLTELVSHVE